MYEVIVNELLKHMTQAELAEALGCSQPRVYRLSKGIVSVDETAKILDKLAKKYKVKVIL